MAAAAGVLTLSGCGAGFHPQTTPSLQPRDGQNKPVIGYTSPIAIRHAFILGPAPDAPPFPRHSDAALYVNILNQTSRVDRLLGVVSPAAGKVLVGDRRSNASASPSATPSGSESTPGGATRGPGSTSTATPHSTDTGPNGKSTAPSPTQPESVRLTIPPTTADTGAVRIGRPPVSDDTITLTDLTDSLDNSAVVKVTFVFQRAGEITVDVPVMPQTGPRQTLSPAPSQSPSTG